MCNDCKLAICFLDLQSGGISLDAQGIVISSIGDHGYRVGKNVWVQTRNLQTRGWSMRDIKQTRVSTGADPMSSLWVLLGLEESTVQG